VRRDSASAATTAATDGARLVYLPWYTRDFMSATRGWSLTAKGLYRELLDAQWDMGSLPSDPHDLQQLAGATAAEWRTWDQFVATKFPLCADGRRRNSRLEQHRQKALHVSAVRSEIGRRGGLANGLRSNGAASGKPQ
jgi:uncharacterized protein YdaU (DUF1376 family)